MYDEIDKCSTLRKNFNIDSEDVSERVLLIFFKIINFEN